MMPIEVVKDAATGTVTQREMVVPLEADTSGQDQETLNAALVAEGSVVRALALLFLQEINVLRGKVIPALPAYTQAQLVAALKAKMR